MCHASTCMVLSIFVYLFLSLHRMCALALCIPKENYGVQREVWTNIYGGWFLSHLMGDSRYPDNPSSIETLATFDVPQAHHNFYGQRLRAFFVPPVDGNYTFLGTCDSECNFYLSRDDDPDNKHLLIELDQFHRASHNQWDKYPFQRSCSQTLERHKLYYVELLHSNYVSYNHARIHVIYPRSTRHRPIERHHLIRYKSAEVSKVDDVSAECAALKKCGLTCGGGFFTRVNVRQVKTNASCMVPYNISVEKAPDEPPQNVSAQALSSTSIRVKWHKVPRNHRNGIIQGYRIVYSFNRTAEPNKKRWVDEQQRTTYSVLHDAVKLDTVLGGLAKNTLHCIQVLAYTHTGEGPFSPCVYIMSLEDVPSRPPSLKVTTLGTSSISAAWERLPRSHANGIIIGYRLYYKTEAAEDNLILNASTTYKVIDKLRVSSKYCVQIFAFTRVGEGPGTDCHVVWTKSRDMLPLEILAKDRVSPTAIKITWRPLQRGVAPDLSHYDISYVAIKMSGQDVFNSTMYTKNVSHDVNEVILENLTYYATYEIEIMSVNTSGWVLGQRLLYADTCHCDLQSMSTSIKVSPPYTYKAADNSTRGMLVDLLEGMMQHSCGECVVYDGTKNTRHTNDMLLQETSEDEADFILPVRAALDERELLRYIPLMNVPGVALITLPMSTQDYTSAVTTAVFSCWPFLAIGFLLAILAGIIIWFLEQSSHPEQFMHPFHKGLQEGIWWSFVTMTTVGYGDRCPKSFYGRLFAILWFMVGAVLISLMVSSITASLSVTLIDDTLHVTKGKVISSVGRYPDYEVMRSLGGSGPAFTSTEELVEALRSGKLDAIVVDLYTAGFRKDLFNGSWYTVRKVIDYAFTCGVVIGANVTRLEKLFRAYAEVSGDYSIRVIQETQEEQMQFTDVSEKESSEMNMINPTLPIYQMTLAALLGLILLTSLLGLFYHHWYRKRKDVFTVPEIRKCDEYYQTRAEMRELLEEFHKRFFATCAKLRRKHRTELLSLEKYRDKIPVTWV